MIPGLIVDKHKQKRVAERNWFIVRDTTNALRRYNRPSKSDEARREARRLCRVCCYLRGNVIVMMAFTDYMCPACETLQSWPDSGVPSACNDCSDALRICQRCYGDRDAAPMRIETTRKKR